MFYLFYHYDHNNVHERMTNLEREIEINYYKNNGGLDVGSFEKEFREYSSITVIDKKEYSKDGSSVSDLDREGYLIRFKKHKEGNNL